MSDFRAFCQGKCILDIHTEIPNGVLDLAVAKQELNGSKVGTPAVRATLSNLAGAVT